jgi:insertion element IS1 protein InsB
MWSFVGKKRHKVWIWLALEQPARKIIAWATGSRGVKTARKLWYAIPEEYQKKAQFFTDSWKAYKKILPRKRHFEEEHQTNHIERFNNTFRQRCPVLVRKTLSFSKSLKHHNYRIKIFIDHYNQTL